MLENVLNTGIQILNDWLYTYILVILLVVAGIYFSIRTRFVQFRLLGEAFRVLRQKKVSEGEVSSFEALMLSTASRVGTGNIAGISAAICLGGAGAVFWMWVIALLGAASAFIESTLAQIYKVRDSEGGSRGGPAYYIEAALHSRKLAVAFALFLITTYLLGFNMVASYNLADAFAGYVFFGEPYIIGVILAGTTMVCVFGGGKRLTRVISILVPFMGSVYVLIALLMILLHIELLPNVLVAIFENAFDFQAAFSGFTGSAMLHGIRRGLFSNEAGVGSAPNAAAAASVSHPVKQGLIQMLSVFLDTLLICSATAFLCLCSGVEPSKNLAGVPYVQLALKGTFGVFGSWFFTGAMLLFAFTTILGNYYYCESNLHYLLQRYARREELAVFRVVTVIIVFGGTLMDFSLVWNLADILMGCMTLINLPVIFRLTKPVLLTLEDYMRQKNTGEDPVFRARSVAMEAQTEFWN